MSRTITEFTLIKNLFIKLNYKIKFEFNYYKNLPYVYKKENFKIIKILKNIKRPILLIFTVLSIIIFYF